MKTLALLSPLSLLLVLAACQTPPVTTGLTPASEDPFAVDGPATQAEATELALALLGQNERLLEGIDGYTVLSTRIDAAGTTHLKVQQTLDGVDVLHGQAVVHVLPNGVLQTWTDAFLHGINVDTTPALTEAEAIELAVDLHRKGAKLDDDPVAGLFVADFDGTARLVWRVRIVDLDNPHGHTVPVMFLDAVTGELVSSFEDLKETALQDADKTTYDAKRSTRLNRASVGDSSDTDLAMTHDAVGSTLAYLSGTLGRDSFNDAGGLVRSYGHYGRDVVNAYWDGSRILIGDGDGSYANYLGVLDIVAHEFGHALTQYEADMVYSDEPGALNEAASDILAATVEASVDGGTSASAWDIGEDCWLADSALRFMASPSDDGSSRDHYSDRYTGSQDSGGVHWNSGIANHFFYLLSEGGQHHNPAYRSGYSVAGIGIDDAYAIWYAALTGYMTTTTDFSAARTATEGACAGLGMSAATCLAVSQAWYEVGVGSDPGGDPPPPPPGDSAEPPPPGDSAEPPPPPAGCDAGYTETTGTLSGAGDDDQYAYTAGAGTHSVRLSGPSGTDFDLALYEYKGKGYKSKATSTTSGSEESLDYDGGSGDFLIQVSSYSGSGDYVLCTLLP